jgi:hypothetical protein
MTAKKDLLGDDIEQARIDSLVTRLFAQEEKELFKFLEKNPEFQKPDWRHIWYYRFLQISPSYNFLVTMLDSARPESDSLVDDVDDVTEDELDRLEEIENRKAFRVHYTIYGRSVDIDPVEFCKGFPQSQHKNIKALLKTYKLNGDIRKKTLKEWWIDNGQYLFESVVLTKISTIADIQSRQRISFRKFHDAIESLNDFMKTSNNSDISHSLVLGISISNSKDEVMKVISDYLDETINFDEPQETENFIDLKKSKAKEKKFEEAYTAIFFKTRYKKLTNVQIAKKANILWFSQQNLSATSSNSSRSLESGFSRCVKDAINIAENAAHGIFPEDEELYDFKEITRKYLNEDTFKNIYKLTDWSMNNPDLVRDIFGSHLWTL